MVIYLPIPLLWLALLCQFHHSMPAKTDPIYEFMKDESRLMDMYLMDQFLSDRKKNPETLDH